MFRPGVIALLLLATTGGAAQSQPVNSGDAANSGFVAPKQTIKDDGGGIFMEETTAPVRKPKTPVTKIDMSNVGIQVDPQGKIIPLLNPGAPPVQQQGSTTEAYTQFFVPSYPYGGSVPVNVPGLIPYSPFAAGVYGAPYGAPYGGLPAYGAPYGAPYGGYPGYGLPGGLSIGLGKRFGLNIGGGLPLGGYGSPFGGYGGYPGSYPGIGAYGGVPFSVAPFGTPTGSMNFPVIYGNGTMSTSSEVDQSIGLGIGPQLGWKRRTNSFSTPDSFYGTQQTSSPWLNSSSAFGSTTRSLLGPLMQPQTTLQPPSSISPQPDP